ncbi:putative mitochondrial hypothetical protein [Leptomonas pyrrhocoris]|uniref:G domain-containing protein n=1 Tax=Leptomonas pyrrhocoris TaxID=157538 RepID=A0A0N0DZ71_LEPPY|nr:putative mitochondrial hypothetical protein [Leptomonas pyrrhocoris]XP_015663371.1 putative mitochondrial hypothetical protein [Leptomonas pyrrhocoris]KPA84931.1 putative mitochondrial hypothetical protein [Leptomonas pyrrhocoris]KPA84932.1 putative mitochondrial hypothetical protein [Leptomonas pyrrhocoris]|eukprot:XP_015663370.1 putative mitochondrial hypothetical protein [Leptomonas pyrrhocoris]
MLSVLCVLRCALSATHIHLNGVRERFGGSVSSESRADDQTGLASSSAEMDRAEAIESFSNEVFGCGNKHLKNVETLTALPEGLHSFPEICFIGKPNCGKSSLISCLLHNARLGKAGATGGTTRLLQFFNVGDALLLVDTPGYGGWKWRKLDEPLAARANAFSILFRYLALRNGSNLKRVYWLMEASARSPVSFQPRDEEILAFLSRERIPFSVILTKIDRHWRLCADQQRKTAVIGKDGLVHPGHVKPKGSSYCCTTLPEEGVARNMREVFGFLGTDTVPILGVSANREQPARSRNIEILQHDIAHYCTQDLLPGETPTLTNLRKLSYAPPSADRIQEIQLRYPVESFVVPQNNNLSLARMVEQHEEMKAHLLERHVSAGRLTAKEVAACHLGSVGDAVQAIEDETLQRSRLGDVIPSTTFLFEVPSHSVELFADGKGNAVELAGQLTESGRDTCSNNTTSVWREPGTSNTVRDAISMVEKGNRPFRIRPSLASRPSSLSAQAEQWHAVLGSAWESQRSPVEVHVSDEKVGQVENAADTAVERSEPSLSDGPVHPAFLSDVTTITPPTTPTGNAHERNDILLQERSPSSLSLPAMLNPHANYVTAIDGTRIPRSMISVSVEKLAVNKEDELTHFATKSGAGAYEELLLLDQEDEGTADPFTETDGFARLPEVVQTKLLDTKQCRTRSAARRQEERFLAKYVAKKRKARSISMHAEGYMCPWLGISEKRDVVRGVAGNHNLGTGGAVIRGLKQTGFGGKSYSARTMKHRGRATAKTGSWAA